MKNSSTKISTEGRAGPKCLRWWQRPLLHFLLIGLGLFALHEWTGSWQPGDEKTIVVDREALLTYVQYRAKFFDDRRSGSLLDDLSERELAQLIDDYVREEVLFREAVSLGLDRNDFIIRQRLVQKLEFINRDLTAEFTELTDEDVQHYFDANRDAYFEPPHVTFTHVFFDNRKGGREHARARAKQKLAEFNARQVLFNEGPRQGDRFLYHVNYVERSAEHVASHFGPDMAGAVIDLEPRDDLWYGPFESQYGFHLVMIADQFPGRHPHLPEIYERVKQDAYQAYIQKKNEAVLRGIIDAYEVRVTYQPAPPDTAGTDHPESASRAHRGVVFDAGPAEPLAKKVERRVR